MPLFARALSLLLAVGAAVLLEGCTPLKVYRDGEPASDCVADLRTGALLGPDKCRSAMAERASSATDPGPYSYSMYFVEFDDQGWAFPDKEGATPYMNKVLAELRERIGGTTRTRHPRCVSDSNTVNVVVYVHGWKHNASYNDSNVENFRKLVHEVAVAECAGLKREVVALYVGWRGKSVDVGEPVDSASFWTRKNTAAEVAQGSVRELFARIDAMVDAANEAWKQPGTAAARAKEVIKKPVRMLLIGHSFGGHILLTALNGSVIKSMAAFDEAYLTGGRKGCSESQEISLSRDGDMVLLVNAAIEGTRFEPLFSVARNWKYSCYRAPMLVAVTSDADTATKRAFPAGRRLSTLMEDYWDDEERTADRKTFGHNRRYLTHELRVRNSADPEAVAECKDWNPEKLPAAVHAEFLNEGEFTRNARKSWDPTKARVFCAGAVLVPLAARSPWYAPVLNITTSADLIKGHNEIYEPRFVSFVRELYMDTLRQEFDQLRR